VGKNKKTMKKQLTKTAMKKRLTKTAKWRIAAICLLFLLWGIGGFAQPVTNMQATNYTANKVAFTITWDGSNYNDSLWVIIDYVKVENAATVGNWSRATVTYGEVTGDVSGNTVAGGQGCWIFPSKDYGNASVTAWLTLAGDVEQFNWCAYALNVPPRAVLLSDGSYQLYGTKPFTVNGTTLGNTVSSFGPGACMTSFTDFTGNPAGIFTAAPTVSTSNPAARCDAGAVTLTATAAGGTTTAMTYTWIVGGGAPQTTTSGSYSPSAALGSTTYSVTVTNAAGCTGAAATGTITVNALPAVPTNASTNARCGTGAVTFSATAPASCTIDWYNASAGGATVATGVTSYAPTISATTTYYAQARNTATGCVNLTRLMVTGTVHPTVGAASISGSYTNACPASTVALTASATGATSFTWFMNGSSVTTTSGNQYAVTATGSYSVAGYNAGCTGATATQSNVIITPCYQVNACSGLFVISSSAEETTNVGDKNTAQSFCSARGARLPTRTELCCLLAPTTSVTGGMTSNKDYWNSGNDDCYICWRTENQTSTSCVSGSCVCYGSADRDTNNNSVRCVK
jgi:hypothetical protein